MDDKEKIISIIAPYVSAFGEDAAIADALIAAGVGDVTEYKKIIRDLNTDVVVYRALSKADTLEQIIEGQKSLIDEYRHRSEVAEKERDEWKERAERMHKEALKQKQLVSDSKHREDALRNQLECAMDMVSEMEHAKRTLKILYMSGAITEEALGDAVKQTKREIEEEKGE